jgi:hypothetical protein
VLAVSSIAHATPLENAVAQYNASVSLLPALWSDFQNKQSAAFVDAKGYFDNMNLYFENVGTDDYVADAAWSDMEGALVRLETVSINPVDPALYRLLEALRTSANDYQKVKDLDALFVNETAYDTGVVAFQVTKQPFIFWNNPGLEDYDDWFEFSYPGIAVGDNSHTPILCSSIGDWITWIAGLFNPWAGTAFWLPRVRQAPQQIVDPAVSKLQELCDYCQCQLMTTTTFDDCLTQSTVDFWCGELKDDDCGETDPFKANQALSGKWDCWGRKNVGAVGRIAVGAIKPPWVDLLDFAPTPE